MFKVWPIAGLLASLLGCAPSASEGTLHSPDPNAKLYAIVRAGERKDRSAIPELIEQLDSDDQAVRMYAIQALQRITGERMGYIHYAEPEQRRESVDRWVEAYKSGKFGPVAPKTATP
jgi:HEAT repeat protein